MNRGSLSSRADAATTTVRSGTDGRNSRWDQHRQQRRSQLIRAARAAVHDLGPQASMEEIAGHAGTSKSVFYRYFGDKNGLQAAVGQRAIEFMEREVLSAAERSETELDGLFNMVSTYLRLAASSPNVYAFATTRVPPENGEGSGGGTVPGAMAGFFDRITTVLDTYFRDYLSRTGRTPGPDSPTWYWPRAAVGMVRSAGESWLSGLGEPHHPDAERMARRVTAWLTLGLSGTYPLPDSTAAGITSAPAAQTPSDTPTPEETR